MKTNTILSALALAMLLTTACGKNEITNEKGYPLSVTLNVTREGDEATTRATYNESTKKLSFSTGDQLFVFGEDIDVAGNFAGALTWQSGGTFSGTILTSNPYSGTAEELFADAEYTRAALLPNGYEGYGYIQIGNPGTSSAYVYTNFLNIYTNTKTEAVEQLSYESANAYSNPDGFALSPQNAILNFRFLGLPPNTDISVFFKCGVVKRIDKTFKTDGSGTISFLTMIDGGINTSDFDLIVSGYQYSFDSRVLEAGHIYTVSRNVPSTP